MSSLSETHEARAEWAIKAADLLLWVVDPVDVFGAKEGSFLQRAKEIEIPIKLAISKGDSLIEDESEALVGFIHDRFGYGTDDIFVVAAQEHSPQRPNAGMQRLASTLNGMARDVAAVKEKALAGKSREIREECDRIAALMLEICRGQLDWLQAESELLRRQRLIVQGQLLDEFEIRLRRAIRGHLLARLPSDLSSDAEELQGCIYSFVSGSLPSVVDAFLADIREQAGGIWGQQFQLREEDLRQQIHALIEGGLGDENTVLYLQEQFTAASQGHEALREAFSEAARRSDGPFSAQTWSVIAGGAAAFLAHAVVPLLGGVVLAWYLGRKGSAGGGTAAAATTTDELRDAIASQFSTAIGEAVTERLQPVAEDYLAAIEQQALDRMSRERYRGASRKDIEETFIILSRISAGLKPPIAASKSEMQLQRND